jgi:hypothetical protein
MKGKVGYKPTLLDTMMDLGGVHKDIYTPSSIFVTLFWFIVPWIPMLSQLKSGFNTILLVQTYLQTYGID